MRHFGAVFQGDLEVVRLVWTECLSFCFAEDIREVVVLLWDIVKVNRDGGNRRDLHRVSQSSVEG